MGRSRWRALAAVAALPLLAASCSGFGSSASAQTSTGLPALPPLHESTPNTIGLADTEQGYTFDSAMATLPADQDFQFRILRPDGKPQMQYLWDQTKMLHFLAIRDDFDPSTFAHVHPTLASDGTWSVHLPLTKPGPYQLYVDFLLKDATGLPIHLVLRRQLTVPGPYQLSPVAAAPTVSGSVDGYTVTFQTSRTTTMDGKRLGTLKGYTVMYLPATITYQGKPFSNLQPYLAVWAHFTAFNIANDLYGHAHPLEYAGSGREGWPLSTFPVLHGGPDLTFHAEFPGAGDYVSFVEFLAGGQLHTASMTLHVQ